MGPLPGGRQSRRRRPHRLHRRSAFRTPAPASGGGANSRAGDSPTDVTQIRLLILDAHDRAVLWSGSEQPKSSMHEKQSRRSTGRCLAAPLPPLPQHHRARARALDRRVRPFATALLRKHIVHEAFSRGYKTALPQRPRARFPFPSGPLCGTLDSTQPCAAAAWCFPAREAAKGIAKFSWQARSPGSTATAQEIAAGGAT